MKYTQIPINTVQTLQMNAGIIAKEFDPETGAVTNVMGATTGGFSFATNPNYIDLSEDIDNAPANTWQFKRITHYDPTVSGTFLTVTAGTTKELIGSAEIDSNDETHIIPHSVLTEEDFDDVWVIGDYSDKNTGNNAGYYAIHIMHALNTAGFRWTTTKDGKGQFAFEYHGHYDYEDIDTVPFEIYVKAGTGNEGTENEGAQGKE